MYTVKSHHEVLRYWAELRNNLSFAPRLLTLDHHTDTSKPFRRKFRELYDGDISNASKSFEQFQGQLIKDVDYKNPSSIDTAISNLNNDEHIVLAIESDIVSSAFVVAHNATNTDLDTYLDHKIACRTVSDSQQTRNCSQYRQDCDRVLESSFLKSSVEALNKLISPLGEAPLLTGPFILDIDLDYFNTLKSVSPEDRSYFDSLLQSAALVTVATEPDYVTSCALDEGLDSAQVFQALFKPE